MSDPKSSIPDSSTLNVRIFREMLQEAEREGADIGTKSVTPKTPRQDIEDAKDFLRSNLPKIVRANPDLSEVLDVLYSKQTISQEERDTIKLGSVQEQIRKTLHTIMNKGQESCMEFIQLMDQHHAELMTDL